MVYEAHMHNVMESGLQYAWNSVTWKKLSEITFEIWAEIEERNEFLRW